MKPIVIIKTGETMAWLRERCGDFEDWIAAGLGAAGRNAAVVAPYRGEELPAPENFSGVIITGSHAMVTDREAWSERTAAWIPGVVAAETPFLGICYGHQLLAHAMGGRVDACAIGVVIGTVEVDLRSAAAADALLGGLPGRISVYASHTQSVTVLPPGATLLAGGKKEPHHAFSIGNLVGGVQFHPEFDSTIMGAYVDEFAGLIRASGQNPDDLRRGIRDAPFSRSVLKRFAEIAIERSVKD